MAKELPYFEFEPAEYLAGNISFCSLETQGLFTLICCYYWQRSCSLTKDQFLRRMNKPKELEELITENVIKIKGDFIVIDFLNEKFKKATQKSTTNSKNGAKGGRPKKPKESEIKPNALNSLSESKGIREDKIKEKNIKQEFYNSFTFLEAQAKAKKTTVDCINRLKEVFWEGSYEGQEEPKSLNDLKTHFGNWLKYQELDRIKPTVVKHWNES